MTRQPVRIVYRSRRISIPLLAALEASDAWEKAGLEVQRLDYVSGAAESDPLLFNGEVDFIFGSHISPYIHKANGRDIVYLGQSVNWANDRLITREPLTDLASLRGQVIAEGRTDTPNHPWGNHKLYLQRGGVDLTQVDFVGGNEFETKRKAHELVAEEKAFAAFVSPPNDLFARMAGLSVQELPALPMVQSTTITTMWETRANRPELCRAVISAVREGIRFFRHEREAMLKVMETTVGDKLGIKDEGVLHSLYETNRQLFNERLYPTPAAIENAYRIAVMQDPSIQGRVTPMELWDVDLLREADAKERAAASS